MLPFQRVTSRTHPSEAPVNLIKFDFINELKNSISQHHEEQNKSIYDMFIIQGA
jgi:hypothetical protein